ncbi:MAG: dihydropyrimidinase [Halanaerobiales bacterium]|nr:dihydropyrimidinase [Halanaerobiales bacterium]
MSIYIKNGKVIKDSQEKKLNILIEDETIKKVAKQDEFTQEEINESEIIDAKGCYVFPGMIDAHTHYLLKSRDAVTADDFYTGSLSAAFGGVTTFIDYIDDEHKQDKDFKKSLEDRKHDARDSVVDYTFHQTVTHFDQDTAMWLREVKDEGISSIKIFTTYRAEGYLIDKEKLYELFRVLKQLKLLPTVHAEDNEIIEKNQKKFIQEGKKDISYHPDIRTDLSEARAVENIAELSEIHEIPAYIAHLSSKKGLNSLKEKRSEGVNIHAETTPHYLLLDRSFLNREDGYLYFMTPPLRTKEDNESLWNGLVNDDIDVVATDHCAFKKEQKQKGNNAFDILPGIPGSETLLPLIYNFGREKGLNVVDIVNKLSKNPAKIYGLYPQKGSLKEDTDADIVIFDPEKVKELNSLYLHSSAGYSPYDHIEVKGYPITTISRGNIIINRGSYRGFRGNGKYLKANKSSLF